MNAERWYQVDKILQEALELEPRERTQFLDRVCSHDPELREELGKVLQSNDRAGSFLARPLAASFPGRQPGTAIGPYVIEELVGMGGMGEVYRATDTRLGRVVAVKMVRDQLAKTSGFRERLGREARAIASLNHPHVCALYDVGAHDETTYLVMEYVSGELLSDVLKSRRIEPGKALGYAREIADALAAVHARGILHRDLKPGNVMITETGIKVLDFGLAKFDAVNTSPDLESPTDPVSHPGLLLGTAAYMSPEQARGQAADKRSDIWAFGCVLYEMLTGKRAFNGSGTTEILAAVLKSEPDWNALPAELTPSIRRLLRGCLEKNTARRIADISTALFLLDEPAGPADRSAAKASWLRFAAFFLIVTAVVAGAGTVVWWKTQPPPLRATRLNIDTAAPAALTVDQSLRNLAIAPDGSRIVYVGNGGTQLFVRDLYELEPVALTSSPGTPVNPFFSPDGQWVGFFNASGRSLMKVPITGGPVTMVISGYPSPVGLPRGATWGPDGTIVFASVGRNRTQGLERVSMDGGQWRAITTVQPDAGEDDHVWPEFLPGGQAVLFTITSTTRRIDDAQIAVLDLRTGKYKSILRGGSHAHYVQTGHLVYAVSGTLRAVAFDLDRLETVGVPVPVPSQVVTTANGAADFAVARDGTLAYVSGGFQTITRSLVWVDRQGREEPIGTPPRAFLYPRLSPDGSRIALDIRDQGDDIWVMDVGGENLRRITSDPLINGFPVWTRDGSVIYGLNNGPNNLYSQVADGTGEPKRLTESPLAQFAHSVTPDGKWLVYSEQNPPEGRNLMMRSLDNSGRIEPLVRTQYVEQNGTVSPNSLWLAYESNETGQAEIYVRPFPKVNQVKKVSTGGGLQPVWRRDGKELFYWDSSGALMGVAVGQGATWSSGTPVRVVQPGYFLAGSRPVPFSAAAPTYDVSLDGRRFLMIKQPDRQNETPMRLVVMQNWLNELQALSR